MSQISNIETIWMCCNGIILVLIVAYSMW